ncbi:unnamed protein product [Protopolystoma xenopodis]|uniref:Uncharacterized protein n=1 Tax=Protopolystoma xenopodis TaxID=117903 RepID=A0A3S5B9U5_9PLAT|nr:unnamed protein product [Protopolystoma xenopodis]
MPHSLPQTDVLAMNSRATCPSSTFGVSPSPTQLNRYRLTHSSVVTPPATFTPSSLCYTAPLCISSNQPLTTFETAVFTSSSSSHNTTFQNVSLLSGCRPVGHPLSPTTGLGITRYSHPVYVPGSGTFANTFTYAPPAESTTLTLSSQHLPAHLISRTSPSSQTHN